MSSCSPTHCHYVENFERAELSRHEKKHWSKAIAAILRYEDGLHSIPPHTLPFWWIIAVSHESAIYGKLDLEKLHGTISRNHRFRYVTVTSPSGWWEHSVQAI